ncbi:MAG: CaiB/BaiF CoA-transferase family protein [Alphaproteobacteria bacterium]
MSGFDPGASCPLDGVRVLDLSRVVAGNALTVALADYGAEVIKVEPPGKGDDLRAWRVKGNQTYWKAYARNKKSLTLNLRHAAARDILLRLVETAQVLVENYRPGTLEKMGLGPDVLWARNPGLVVVRVSGWGQTGPYRDKPGFGSLVEAFSGYASLNGFADRPRVLPPLALADRVAGTAGAVATLVALREVEVKGGKGQVIDLPLLDPLLSILGPLAANYKLSGQVDARIGSRAHATAPRNVYGTADGRWVALSASTQGTYERLMKTIGAADVMADPRFATNGDRIANCDELDAIIGGWIGARSLAENLAVFEAEGITVGPVNDISDLVDHPLITGRGIFVDVPDADADDGSLPIHNLPVRLTGTPGAIRRPAPILGQHNAELLQELGVDEAARQRLADDGAL